VYRIDISFAANIVAAYCISVDRDRCLESAKHFADECKKWLEPIAGNRKLISAMGTPKPYNLGNVKSARMTHKELSELLSKKTKYGYPSVIVISKFMIKLLMLTKEVAKESEADEEFGLLDNFRSAR
jgi:hypothetical protein